ncbi:RecF/RecN/SMC N terminal domain-containing protein [Seiridium cupressi]
MPARRRSRSMFEDDEDAQSSGPEASKRQRRRETYEAENEELQEDEELEDDDSAVQLDYHTAPNEYSPGAVVRVKLVNFVTYEKAVFYPGPNLNMIIGPNGTGKSSLVCALALGLGYPTNVLGRATKYSEYVTHGKDSAIIEIELQKRPKEKHNHVIRLQIVRESNNRRFWLNKKETTHKKVQELVARLRIACDNLCQFLPQEKVAEFAGLTPVQLLHETLRAAAPEEMINWQTELKELFKDYKNVKTRAENDAEQLKNLNNRQQGLQADVDRLNERETIKQAIKDMQKARCCAEYSLSRSRYQALNRKKKDAEKRLKNLEQACGPALQAVNDKEAYRGKIEAVLDQRKRALKKAEADAEQAFREVETVEDKIKDTLNQVENERKSLTGKRTEIGKVRQAITKLEADYKTQPPHFDPTEWNQKIREQEHIHRGLTDERRESDEQAEETRQQGRGLNGEIRALRDSISALDSQEGQKVSFLKRFNSEVHQGWEWLQGNLNKFEKEVYGPPMLTCSLKDERYSSLIQSLLQTNDFLCFTCQTREDHKLLSEQFYKTMGLSVTIRTCGSDFQSFRTPMPANEARALGLDGFAIDYVDGPEPVLAMLCSERVLHASGVALKEISSDQFHTLQNGQKINTWATGQTYFRVIRRKEYGPDATTTSTRKVNPGRFWTEQPVDTDEKIELQKKLDEKTDQKKELAVQFRSLEAQTQELLIREGDVKDEINKLRREKSELQSVHTRWTAIPDQIDTHKASYERAQNAMLACKSRIAKHDLKRDELVIEKAQAVLHHRDMVSLIRDAYSALQDVHIRLIEASSDVRGLRSRNSEITKELDVKKQEISHFADDAKLAKQDAQRAKELVGKIVAEGQEGDLERYQAMVQDKSLEDIDNEISAEKAKLELIHAVDPSVLRQFDDRAKKIAELTQENEKLEAKLERLVAQIKELMEKFEPRLENIIGKVNEAFGRNFERISCAGEVGLRKDDDFEQWAIEIKVKFRQNEELQLLNQHRQSGGERAVSTVFYIMALQSMAQAPFRVVDEINQGMDPRNERMVHERMVEIACKEHTSQYFLITPKLLTGLAYDDNMRILCIASGVHVPEEGDKLDFDKLIRRQLALKAGRVGA